MRRVLTFPVAVAAIAALAALAVPASGGTNGGTVTVTPATIATTDTVTIQVDGVGCEDGEGVDTSIIVTVTDPTGSVVLTETHAGAPSLTLAFGDTLQPGVYTVSAVCDIEELGEMGDGAAPAATLFTYTPASFTAVEPTLGDPTGVREAVAAVVAATPTFTG